MTDKRPVVLIADDDPGRIRGWIGALESQELCSAVYDIQGVSGNEFKSALAGLDARRRAARRGDLETSWTPSALDEATILFVDYDLLDLDMPQPPDGQEVAYLARCYSTAQVIVAMNDDGEDPFDLTLRDSPQSFADLTVGSDQIAESFLWSDNRAGGFAPWGWPSLPDAVARFGRRTAEIVDYLGAPLLPQLGLSGGLLRGAPQSAVNFLGSFADLEAVTFRDFLDRSGNGYRRRDRSPGPAGDARVAAARLAKWLEFDVLPGQDLLVDAPHLTVRLPSLLVGERAAIANWNALTSRESVPQTLDTGTLASARFLQPDWLSRAVWWWPTVIGLDLPEVRDPWTIETVPFSFAEDLSGFLHPSDAREFLCEFPESPFRRRYVADPAKVEARIAERLERVRYAPLNNLLS